MERTAFLAGVLAFSVSRLEAAAAAETVTVFAAASLREAFEAAAPAFTKKTKIAVTYNFAGSDALEQQIAAGAPADVFAAANQALMGKAAEAGLLASAPQIFARNRLIAIVRKANPGQVQSLRDLAKPDVRVVLAAATVPAGSYARAALRRLSGRDGFPADFAAAIERNVASDELDVKAVVTKIALGEGDAGVVYSTDVTPGIASQVNVLTFPSESEPDIAYPIATVKGAPDPSGARAFSTFVLTDGQAFLKARGFLAP